MSEPGVVSTLTTRVAASDDAWVCANCGATATEHYCARCGQKRIDAHDWTLRHFVAHLGHELTHLEASRLVRTTVGLLFRPGELTAAYLEGRRASYITPLRVYFTTSALFFLLAWVGFLDASGYKANPSLQTAIHELAVQRGIEPALFREHVNHLFDQSAGVLRFFSVLAAAALLRLLFLRQPWHSLQHLIFALHVFAFEYLLRTVVFGLERLVPAFEVPVVTTNLVRALLLVYLVVAIRRVYGLAWGSTVWRAATFFVLLLGLFFLVILLATHLALTFAH